MSEFSIDEMNVLATAVASLVNNRYLCRTFPNKSEEKTKYRILCSDGKKREFFQWQLVALVEKVAKLAGHNIDGESRKILTEAGL